MNDTNVFRMNQKIVNNTTQFRMNQIDKEELEETDDDEILEEAVTRAISGFGNPFKLETPVADMGILKNEEE